MKILRSVRWILVLAAIGACILELPASAAPRTAVFVRATARIIQGNALSTGNDGWRFTPMQDLYVTSLGIFDADDDGLLRTRQVGIFRTGTGILVTPIVSLSSADSLIDRFRWKDIDPVVLTAGTTYTMASTATPPYDGVASDQVDKFIVRPVVGYDEYLWDGLSYLEEPTLEAPGPNPLLVFGGNFMFSLEPPVPTEAESWGKIKSLY